MRLLVKPSTKPNNPNFSSGPCAKPPGYQLSKIDTSTLGRSHRSATAKLTLERVCTETADILKLPDNYRVAIVPASDTGAMEMIMWSVLGERPVDVFSWESFGSGWLADITQQLRLSNVNSYTADYGRLPDMSQANPDHDVVFTWNGTTSGVRVPDADWISDHRTGLVICDATSAVFAMDLPWDKLDVVTYSWQKVLGGEGGHGMLILGPRAIKRLEGYEPSWPMPKIFRLTKKGKLIEGIFKGATINTPSMLCVVDYLAALDWVRSIGGLSAAIAKSNKNLAVLKSYVSRRDWIHFLAQDTAWLSCTSVCLTLDLDHTKVKQIIQLLASEVVAYDIGAYRDAPAGLRIWCGATIEQANIETLLPWLDWAYSEVSQS
jgi:phosphoserine aminotransferase